MDKQLSPRAALAAPAGVPGESDVPLVVDLDGTLLRTDTLIESLFALARVEPAALLRIPIWLAHGRAGFKRALAQRARVDVHTLPFDAALLSHLRTQRAQGRRLILATGADALLAHAVADESGLFDQVLASDGNVNLTGSRKRDRLVAEFGLRGFDYVGNDWRDLPVWAAARRGVVASSSMRLHARVRALTEVVPVLDVRRPSVNAYLGALRVHHWSKNLLLLVALLAAHRLREPAPLLRVLGAMVCFNWVASGIYLLNDLLDLSSDRRHPHKRERALASGEVPLDHALVLVPALWLTAALLGAWIARPLLAILCVYVVTMMAYSLRLKDLRFVDALVLGLGYTWRILAGAVAAGVQITPWLLACSLALFFGLALLKRYAELVALRNHVGAKVSVRAYRSDDAAAICVVGLLCGGLAVLMLATFPLLQPDVQLRWPVWLFCALLAAWIAHMWWMARRGAILGDPVAFALRDGPSQAFGAVTAAILLATA